MPDEELKTRLSVAEANNLFYPIIATAKTAGFEHLGTYVKKIGGQDNFISMCIRSPEGKEYSYSMSVFDNHTDQEILCKAIALRKNAGVKQNPDKSWSTDEFLKRVDDVNHRSKLLDCDDAVERIAKKCHEANKAYCESIGDNSQPSWEDAPDWQKQSARMGVKLHMENPAAGPEASHVSWRAQKAKEGWKYGEKKCPEAKTHPCMVDFKDLPEEQQKKDVIFRDTVHANMPKRKTPTLLTEGELTRALKSSPADKVTKEYMEGRIEEVIFMQMHHTKRLDDTTTICTIYLDNGFSVRGESACVNPENYDKDIGEKIAYENAFKQLWPLFGFVLAEKQFQAGAERKDVDRSSTA